MADKHLAYHISYSDDQTFECTCQYRCNVIRFPGNQFPHGLGKLRTELVRKSEIPWFHYLTLSAYSPGTVMPSRSATSLSSGEMMYTRPDHSSLRFVLLQTSHRGLLLSC